MLPNSVIMQFFFTDLTIFITLGFNIRFIKLELAEGNRNVCIMCFLNKSQDWSVIGEVYEMEKVGKPPRVI
jgi:hypothetical protein